jgi:hypothetical protein
VGDRQANGLSDVFEFRDWWEARAVDFWLRQFCGGWEGHGGALPTRGWQGCGTQKQGNGKDRWNAEARKMTEHSIHSNAKDFLAQTVRLRRRGANGGPPRCRARARLAMGADCNMSLLYSRDDILLGSGAGRGPAAAEMRFKRCEKLSRAPK